MKTFLLCLLFLLNAFLAQFFSQVQISGNVSYKGKGIKDVNVTLVDTYDGATTDENGNYRFETTETGSQKLSFSKEGFSTVEENVEISDQPIQLNTSIKEKITEINTVIISAGTIEASDKKRGAALTPLDIYTTAGADAQVSTGYKFLPGVQQTGETEGLFVRGGTGAETKFFMDGNLVNNYFTASVPGLAGNDRFNTAIFKGSAFSSGGYSALYGQALSAVLLLESVDIPEVTEYSFSVFPFMLSGNYQQVNAEKTKSFGIDAGYFNMGLFQKLINFNTDFTEAPNGINANFNFRIKTKKGGMIKYYGSFDNNKLGIEQESLEPTHTSEIPKIKGQNTFHSLNFRQKFGRYLVNLGSSFSYNQNDLSVGILSNDYHVGDIVMNSKGTYFNGKAVVERKISAVSNVKAGIEINSANDDRIYQDFAENASESKINQVTTSLFAETNLAITKDFSTSIGLRTENNSYLNQWNLAPRFSAAYRISKDWVTSFAYGIFYQMPETQYLSSNLNQDFQKATHYILQLQREKDRRLLRVEAYYKNYDALTKFEAQNYVNTVVANTGSGFAKGIELFFRDQKTFKTINYRISYSYLDSKREFQNYPTQLFPSFAAKHNVSLVASKFVMDWKTGFNASYTYTSGRPFYSIVSVENENTIIISGKVKDYSSLNFSVNYVPSLGKKKEGSYNVIVFGVNNILGRKNVFNYRFSNDGLRSAPVLPAANTFFYVGAMFSFGVDRTQEIIDKNL